MTGRELNQMEFELYTMLYTLAVMKQLSRDKLLLINDIFIFDKNGNKLLQELSEIYPKPDYTTMSQIGYNVLTREGKKVSFSQQDLFKLFEQIQANNGYIL